MDRPEFISGYRKAEKEYGISAETVRHWVKRGEVAANVHPDPRRTGYSIVAINRASLLERIAFKQPYRRVKARKPAFAQKGQLVKEKAFASPSANY